MPDDSFYAAAWPWQDAGASVEAAALVIAAADQAPWTHSPRLRLPSCSAPFGAGTALARFDLPCPRRPGEAGLPVTGPGAATLRVETRRTCLLSTSQLAEIDPLAGTPSQQLYALVDGLVGIFDELRWQAEHQGASGDRAAWLPWAAVPDAVATTTDGPRMALICRLANQLEDTLMSLADGPRQVLRRTRQPQHLSKVQQLDAGCLKWIVRRPGRSAGEKAGPRQQIMAVTRVEDFDTLENRVLRDMLRRCVQASRLYLRDCANYRDSQRWHLIARFERRCRRAQGAPSLRGVRPLTRMPAANYVLQFDRAYGEVWQWYQRLVNRETATMQAWPWQQRLWRDFTGLCLGAVLQSLALPPRRHQLWLRHDPDHGNLILPYDWPGQMPLGGRLVTMLPVPRMPAVYLGLPLRDWLTAIGADYAVFAAGDTGRGLRVLPVWGLHTAATPSRPALASLCAAAAARLSATATAPAAAVAGILLCNRAEAADPALLRAGDQSVGGIEVSGPPGRWFPQLLTELSAWLTDAIGGEPQ